MDDIEGRCAWIPIGVWRLVIMEGTLPEIPLSRQTQVGRRSQVLEQIQEIDLRIYPANHF